MELTRKRAFEILTEIYPEIAIAARKKFRSDQPASSCDSVVTDDTHIIYFDAFKSFPIKVDELPVEPKHWALAFMQPDIQSAADILCRAIFTPEHLARRNREANINALPNVEKVAIERAAKWMMNKCQDPWSYTPALWPTDEEQSSIDRAYETFDSVYPRVSLLQFSQELSSSGMDSEISSTSAAMEESEAIEFGAEMDLEIISITEGTDSKSAIEKKIQRMIENFDYDVFYKKYITLDDNNSSLCNYTKLGNTAQTVRELTKMTIPQNTDIFVDAVQFSRGRWAKALKKKDSVNIADVLFRKYFKLDFTDADIEFRSFDDFCPIKRLALLRAVAWILNKQKWTNVYGFDSSIPEHNLFLSIEEIQRIANAITSKYGKQSTYVVTDTSESRAVTHANPTPSSFSPLPLPMEIGAQNLRNTCVVSPLNNINPAAFYVPHVDSQSQTMVDFPKLPTVQLQTANVTSAGKAKLPNVPTDPNGNVVLHGCEIKGVVWTESYRKFKLEEGAIQAGKYLFEETFTDHDIRHGCYSGRRGSRGRGENKFKFPSNKVDMIFDALAIMRDLSFSSSNYDGTRNVKPWSIAERNEITRKIFTEHRNYLARKISPDCSPNCVQCLE